MTKMTFGDYWSQLIKSIPYEMYVGAVLLFGIVCVILFEIYGLKKSWRNSLRLLLLEYVVLIYSSTVIFRRATKVREFDFMPFWSYSQPELFVENVTNVVIFVPVGLLVGVALRRITWKKVLMIGMCLSVGIEMLQLVFKKGFSEVDDVMHNTLGCVIGYGFCRLLSRLHQMLHEGQVQL